MSALVKTDSFAALNLFDKADITKAELLLGRLVKTDKGGIKSLDDGLAIMLRAQELKLPFTTCIEHIHVVNGKTNIDVHIIKTLLLRAGVTWTQTKDYTPLYQYTDGCNVYNKVSDDCVLCKSPEDAEKITNGIGVYPIRHYKDLKGTIYNELEIIGNDKIEIAKNLIHATALAKAGKYPIVRIPLIPIDYVTEYEFKRPIVVNGTTEVITNKYHFSLKDAEIAGLLTKDNYQKYSRQMIEHRAFTYGARDIAPDLIMGCLESTEAAVINNTNIDDSMIDNIVDTECVDIVD